MKKRSVKISGHSTSVTLEQPFWDELKRIAAQNHVSLNDLIAKIDKNREGNLSSALRVFVLKNLQQR